MGNQVQNQVSSIRSARGLSVSELAKRIDVTRQTLYAIEAGTYVPNTVVALRLAHELEVTVEALFQLPAPAREDSASFHADFLSSRGPVKGQAVRLCRIGAKWVSIPVTPSPSYLPEADGFVAETTKTKRAKLTVFAKEQVGEKRLIIAGCDPATGLLARMVEKICGVEVVHAPASSGLALKWLKEGKVHIAGSHLQDPETAEFNLPFIRRQFPKQRMAVVTFAEWEEGFIIARGNPKNIRSVGDLAKKGVRFVNRETGSGSRALLDRLLKEVDLPSRRVTGYDRIALGHLAAASIVLLGDADCCLATRSAAQTYGLDFVPLHYERYDLVLRPETLEHPAAQAFCDALQRAVVRRKLETLAGYGTSKTGALLNLSSVARMN